MPDRRWSEYVADLMFDEIGLIEPAVCVTHRRFVPCRRDEEACRISTAPADVEAVRAYQSGEKHG